MSQRWLAVCLALLLFLDFWPCFIVSASAAENGRRSFSFAIYDLSNGRWVEKKDEHLPMLPASTMKLVTAIAALDTLGPEYRWTTRVYSDSKPSKDGQIGRLWIVGSGDPMFLDKDFDLMLNSVYESNIRKIDTLAIDLHLFDHKFLDTLGDKNVFAPYNIGPFPFVVNYKTTEVDVLHQGNRVLITANNYLPGSVSIDNRIKLSSIPCSQASIDAYYVPGKAKSEGKIVVRGTDSVKCSHHEIYLSFMTHQQYIENLFRRRWREITGNSLTKSIFDDAPKKNAILIATHRSYPLSTTLIGMNKFSNNLMSYLTFLSIGYASDEKKATFEAAHKKLISWLKEKKISTKHISIRDGCGISKDTRVTVYFLSELLRHAFHQNYFRVLLDSLPIAGKDGTLSYRFNNSRIKDHAFMKTGTLKNVRALAGYWKTPNNHWYSFAAIVNCKRKCNDDDLAWLDKKTEKLYLSLSRSTISWTV
ncbi:D-alanyl-D-alanine carboxypeptidase/D-alanyl-D-alanine endopeptidase [Candidatus Ichthyocystis hellenicum]|uniref:D-alanyl-D-alanine carboxypeptidase/D-alanyl-D-alanine endopeptidase n=1 Tax=Candidatus Ichthyocystis hellenicum TaxID=1561003 RepID=UPI001584AC56|nr:D-alanyl-D-alanine carboxypeptidase/D-alanyl-D-alanine-endopeptidase [Candidatus Ichthyocystis hellenicum]